MSTGTVTQAWAGSLAATSFDDLPPAVVHRARLALLDFLGVALAGRDMPMSRLTAAYLFEQGGQAQASVIGEVGRLPAVNAALLNGLFGHALDLDDGHRVAAGHPGVACIPAALAAAELAGASGRELLRAVVLGFEVFVRLGAAINPAHLNRGFHTSATVAPFASAMAAGTLLGLSADELVNALGLAGVQGAGYMEVLQDGAMAKPYQVARSGSAGLLAVELARRGAEGPRTILDGGEAFVAATAGEARREVLLDGLGDWGILGVYFKEHAACRHTHTAVDAAAALRAAHDLRPEQVERVRLRTYAVADRLCGGPEWPSGPSQAKFSLPFTVAAGLTFGHARQSCFAPAMLADDGLRALAARVAVEVDPELERLAPGQRGAILEVATADGRALRQETYVARGEPELPLTDDDVRAKFLDNARGQVATEQAQAVLATVEALDEQESCAGLIDLLAGRVPAGIGA